MVEFLIYGILTGIATAIFASMVDFCLDYGHILGNIRYKKAKQICCENDKRCLWMNFEKELKKLPDFTDRLEFVDGFYWTVAVIEPSFTAWICKICFGTRINLILTISIVLSGLYFELYGPNLFVFMIASILTNFFFIKKVI